MFNGLLSGKVSCLHPLCHILEVNMTEMQQAPRRLAVAAVIVIENSKGEADHLIQLCRRSFAMPVDIKTFIGKNAEVILFDLKNSIASFPPRSVVFLDICLEPDPGVHSGREVAQFIRDNRSDIAIILYSVRADRAICDELTRAGLVDAVAEKELIVQDRHSSDAFNTRVENAMKMRPNRSPFVVKVEPHAGSVSEIRVWLMIELISRIGRDDLSDLIGACVKGAIEADLEYLAPGFSGSHVMRAKVKRSNQQLLDIVLKLTRDFKALSADLNHISEVGAIPRRLLPHLRTEGIQSSQYGWHGYAMERVSGAPLADLINTDKSATLTSKVLESVRQLYQVNHPTSCRPLQSAFWSDAERASTIVELSKLKLAFERYTPNEAGSLSDILSFVKNNDLFGRKSEEIDQSLGELPAVWQHGDLHMNNIMVDTSYGTIEVCLIDWSRYALHPLGFDHARLESEFRLRVVDVEDSSELDLKKIAEWAEVDQAIHIPNSIIGGLASLPQASPWSPFIKLIRQEAQLQIDRASSATVKSRLYWWYYFSLFRNYVKCASYGRIPPSKKLWAFSLASRLGKMLTSSL
jgi:hypothetical protein